MTISVMFNDKDAERIKNIEDEHDIKAYEHALAEYAADPVTYTPDEVMEMMGIEECPVCNGDTAN